MNLGLDGRLGVGQAQRLQIRRSNGQRNRIADGLVAAVVGPVSE